jgi:predicted metal-dependent hydrolase
MEQAKTTRAATEREVELDGRRIDYRVVHSKTARWLRLRVGPTGIEVLKPIGRSDTEAEAFLTEHAPWIFEQLRRAERLRRVRRPERHMAGQILFRGEPTRVRVESGQARGRHNAIALVDGEIVIRRGSRSSTPIMRSLENWLRRRAREAIEKQLEAVSVRFRHQPRRVYVMGQRTKWGNCSNHKNLSFNWRLILAPGAVLQYLVTHEAVHLAVPDHSAKFWLTLQSLCPETERARQWLSANGHKLRIELPEQ